MFIAESGAESACTAENALTTEELSSMSPIRSTYGCVKTPGYPEAHPAGVNHGWRIEWDSSGEYQELEITFLAFQVISEVYYVVHSSFMSYSATFSDSILTFLSWIFHLLY